MCGPWCVQRCTTLKSLLRKSSCLLIPNRWGGQIEVAFAVNTPQHHMKPRRPMAGFFFAFPAAVLAGFLRHASQQHFEGPVCAGRPPFEAHSSAASHHHPQESPGESATAANGPSQQESGPGLLAASARTQPRLARDGGEGNNRCVVRAARVVELEVRVQVVVWLGRFDRV